VGIVNAMSRTILLALLVVVIGCGGGSDDAAPDPNRSGACEPMLDGLPVVKEPLSGLAALDVMEAELRNAGRADSGLDELFGDDSQELFEELAAMGGRVIDEVAADYDLELPDESTELPERRSCQSGFAPKELRGAAVAPLFGMAMSVMLLDMLVPGVKPPGGDGWFPPSKPYEEDTTTTTGGVTKRVRFSLGFQFGNTKSKVFSRSDIKGEISETRDGKTTTMRETSTIMTSIDFCPDASGIAHGGISVLVNGEETGANLKYHSEVANLFDLVVSDAAELTAVKLAASLNYATHGSEETDVSLYGSLEMPPSLDSTRNYEGHADRQTGSAERVSTVSKQTFLPGVIAAAILSGSAEKKWKDGTCVEVKVDPPSKNVGKGERIHVTGKPWHRFEEKDLSLPVTASFEGVASASPLGKPVPAPASFDVVAGSNKGDSGTISLKSTSKRGIGTGSATYTVDCDMAMPCAEGLVLDPMTCMCGCPGNGTCPSGSEWDESSSTCKVACVDGKVAGLPCRYSGTTSVEGVAEGNTMGMSANVTFEAKGFEGCSVLYEPTGGELTFWTSGNCNRYVPATVDLSAANLHGTFVIGLSPLMLVADYSGDWQGTMYCGDPETATPAPAVGLWIYVQGAPIEDARTLEGTQTLNLGPNVQTSTWHLTGQ